MEEAPLFSGAQLQAIATALGHTEEGLTNREIEQLIIECKMRDPGPMTKRDRVYNAFVDSQNRRRDRIDILVFIRKAVNPARYINNNEKFETLRLNLNKALAFAGLAVTDSGQLVETAIATTLAAAERRANDLRSGLEARRVHPDVLRFCRAELLQDNYFHAVLEATKSVAEKIRSKTGLIDDGAVLVDRALCGKPPLLAINPLRTASEQTEQSGFANLVKGIFGMFRNPVAHEARINWNMSEEDAEDLLTTLSLIHRRLDGSHMPPRV